MVKAHHRWRRRLATISLGRGGGGMARRFRVVVLGFRCCSLFVIHHLPGVAETNRHPFRWRKVNRKSLQARWTEYSGMTWSMFLPGRIRQPTFICAPRFLHFTGLFMGGWLLSPVPGIWVSEILDIVQTILAAAS